MKFWAFIVGLVCVCSCKKELTCEGAIQLTDEHTSFLVGEWKWSYTVRKKDYGTGSQFVDTIFNDDSNDNYSISFSKNGKVTMCKNKEIEGEFCVIDSSNFSNSSSSIEMYFYFNNKDDYQNSLQYSTVNSSNLIRLTIYNMKFPFSHYEYDSSSDLQTFHTNYFEKQ